MCKIWWSKKWKQKQCAEDPQKAEQNNVQEMGSSPVRPSEGFGGAAPREKRGMSRGTRATCIYTHIYMTL